MDDTQKLIDLEKNLCEYKGSDQIISSYDLQESFRQEDRTIEIKSWIPSLDKYINGFQGGEVTIISGLTGNGKTLFCQSLTKNFADQNIPSVWFSFEVRAENFIKSFGNKLPLFYMPAKLRENSINWIEKRVHEAKVKYGVKAVFCDHLHFLISMSSYSLSTEIGLLMREIKKLALRLNMCFFLIAHTMKTRPEQELDLGSVRDSSFIEQEADNTFYLWRKPDKENEATLKIAKNRRLGVFGKKVHLIKKGSFLGELVNDDTS